MHKIIIFITVILALSITACENRQEEKKENMVTANSIIDKSSSEKKLSAQEIEMTTLFMCRRKHH